jgi:hypothetical protein
MWRGPNDATAATGPMQIDDRPRNNQDDDARQVSHEGQARIRNASIKKSMSTLTFSETFLRVG